jgi:acetyl-CoA synthetase
MPFDYDKLRQEQTWDLAKRELGHGEGEPVNIGYICVDRHVEAGLGDRLAMIHEGHEGEIRQFTFRDLQQLSNGWAHFLRGNVLVRPLDRVCLLLDKVPELYIGFLGVLKTGAVVEPLFSAFGEDALVARMLDSRAAAIITQRRHLGKVRKARERLPDLKEVSLGQESPWPVPG